MYNCSVIGSQRQIIEKKKCRSLLLANIGSHNLCAGVTNIYYIWQILPVFGFGSPRKKWSYKFYITYGDLQECRHLASTCLKAILYIKWIDFIMTVTFHFNLELFRTPQKKFSYILKYCKVWDKLIIRTVCLFWKTFHNFTSNLYFP